MRAGAVCCMYAWCLAQRCRANATPQHESKVARASIDPTTGRGTAHGHAQKRSRCRRRRGHDHEHLPLTWRRAQLAPPRSTPRCCYLATLLHALPSAGFGKNEKSESRGGAIAQRRGLVRRAGGGAERPGRDTEACNSWRETRSCCGCRNPTPCICGASKGATHHHHHH